jgi:hypothetical protein
MYCSKALLRLLDKFHVSSKKAFREGPPRRAFHRNTPGRVPWEIMEYITEFMTELSFPHDATNAMQGVFHAFSSSSRPVHQSMGNPISHPDAALRNGMSYKPTYRSAEECFVVGLSWFHISLVNEDVNSRAGPGQDGLVNWPLAYT